MQYQFKPQIEATTKVANEFANLAFSQFERFTNLSVEQAKISAELAYEQAQSLLEIRSPSAAIELLNSQLETSVKSLAGYAATVLELGEEFHAETTTFAEGHFEQIQTNANKAILDLLKKAPQGSEAAVTSVKEALDATNKAIAQAHAAAKKTTELAKEGLAKLKEHAPTTARTKGPARRKARAF